MKLESDQALQYAAAGNTVALKQHEVKISMATFHTDCLR
jgi:hypothetical protein